MFSWADVGMAFIISILVLAVIDYICMDETLEEHYTNKPDDTHDGRPKRNT